MKHDSTLPANVDTTSEGGNAPVSDPFAVDLFAASRRPSGEGRAHAPAEADAPEVDALQAEEGGGRRAAPWHERLPHFSLAQARQSATIASLPPTLARDAIGVLQRIIARYTHVAADDIKLEAIELNEVEWPSAASFEGGAAAGPRVWAVLAVEPGGPRIVAEVDAAFAISMIDKMLGGDGAPPDTLRSLSRTERCVIEFLWLSLVGAMNREMGEPLWRLDGVETRPPSWLTAAAASAVVTAGGDGRPENESGLAEPGAQTFRRGLLSTVRLRVGELAGLTRFYLDPAALRALDAAKNPLLSGKAGRSPRDLVRRFERVAPDVPLRLLIGETEVAAADLSQLERGDVVVVERLHVKWRAGQLSGRVRVRAGSGDALIVTGRIDPRRHGAHQSRGRNEGQAAAAEGAEAISLAVDMILSKDATAAAAEVTERFDMEEEAKAEEGGASGVALEQLLLTMHVELGARRISLDELARLRAGQILDLGCQPTDPVELVADGRRVARGELIDLEGRLGVRVTQIVG